MGLFFLSFCNSFTLLANKYLLTYLPAGLRFVCTSQNLFVQHLNKFDGGGGGDFLERKG